MVKTKVFCIGLGKTGTSSLKYTFEHLEYDVGVQATGEKLIEDYYKNDFKKIINYCNTADFFQDCPFCYPKTYEILERNFPDAKFILSVRDNSEVWFKSLITYHDNKFFNGNKVTKEKMKQIRNGWLYKIFKNIYKTPDEDLYNKQILMSFYEKYNNDIINYFSDKKDKLLVINLSKEDDFNKLLCYLDIKDAKGLTKFYHINKTNYKS